ncbi:MAG: hypothetical protein WC501_00420 [Candidatus Micrarchaeia archaeon]
MQRFFLILIFGFLLFNGCLIGPNPDDHKYSYKGIIIFKSAVPAECIGMEDCEMFSCMVENCWCKKTPPGGGIIFRSKKTINNTNDAIQIVSNYLNSNAIEYEQQTITAAKLNEVFYNVFYNVDGNEQVLTIAIDGTIMETICGV